MPQDREGPARLEALMRAAGRDRSASLVFLAIVRTEARLTREFDETLRRVGLSVPQFNVLMEVAGAPGARLALHDICDRLLKSPPNVTALVDRLERDGLLRRERNREDRRVVMATLTERGWQALATAAPEVFAAERRMLRDLSPADRRELVQQLRRVAR
jgi:DNA-binding MarR family transcriptional regulator